MDERVHTLFLSHLRQPLRVAGVRRHNFGEGPAVQEEIITTNRFILILSGSLEYRIGERRYKLRSGMQFLAPAWVRRVWSVPSHGRCEIIWCEFHTEDTTPTGWDLTRRSLNARQLRLEKSCYLRLLAAWRNQSTADSGAFPELEMEGELKAMLARFWAHAGFPKSMAIHSEPPPIHPRVKQALQWMEEHLGDAKALEKLYEETRVTPNYFRRHFHHAMNCSPGAYLQRLRLRQARYLLRRTDLPLKQIGASVGYDDPLYFSRLYHRFWGHSPGRERVRGNS